MTQRPDDHRRIPSLPLLLLACIPLAAGCATPYFDQVKVPNTNQRLAVGHDGWPFRRVWVLEDGKRESVKIVVAKQ